MRGGQYTMVVLLGLLYIIAIISIISGLDISVLGNLALTSSNLIFALIATFLWKLPKIAKDEWELSDFKLSDAKMKVLVFLVQQQQ